MNDVQSPVDLFSIVLVPAALVALLVVLFFWWKGKLIPGDHVFRASRLSRGNRFFPTQVAITPTSVVHYTPQWVGKVEHSIHMAHVASVQIDTGLMFSDVMIETTGGQHPITCRGHRKGDAVEMKRLIEQFQSAYYRGQSTGNPVARPPVT